MAAKNLYRFTGGDPKVYVSRSLQVNPGDVVEWPDGPPDGETCWERATKARTTETTKPTENRRAARRRDDSETPSETVSRDSRERTPAETTDTTERDAPAAHTDEETD